MGYVPDGLSKEQYANLKKKEADAHAKKKFGAGGVRGFQSRSMQSFVAALEKGEAKHLMPVDPDKVRRGEIPLKVSGSRHRLMDRYMALPPSCP